MANIQRVRVTWQGGGVIGPSVSTFFFSSTATGFKADLVTFYTAMITRIPSIVNVTVPGTGDILDSTTGALVGGWSDGSDVGVAGTGTAQCPQGVGCRIVWITSGFSAGRRVRGSTFIVPADASLYSTDGTLGAGVSTIAGAASALVAAQSPNFIVWTRPTGGSGGGVTPIDSAIVPDKIATLRSRRT